MSKWTSKLSLVNKLIFPAPQPTYTPDSFPEELIWIPEVDLNAIPADIRFAPSPESTSPVEAKTAPAAEPEKPKEEVASSGISSWSSSVSTKAKDEPARPKWETGKKIPCVYLNRVDSDFLIIFYHGNGEDLGGSYRFLSFLLEYLSRLGIRLSVLAVEYPGYGMHAGTASEAGVLQAAESAYRFCRTTLNWPVENLWLWGVSIGTGPATSLASRFEVGGLILTAAYESIRAVVKHLLGSAAQYLISDRFQNFKAMEKVVSPVLFIHGTDDTLIPVDQTLRLFEICQSEIKMLVMPEGVGHTNFALDADIAAPIQDFYSRILRTRAEFGIRIPTPRIVRLQKSYFVSPAADELPKPRKSSVTLSPPPEADGIEALDRPEPPSGGISSLFSMFQKRKSGGTKPAEPDSDSKDSHVAVDEKSPTLPILSKFALSSEASPPKEALGSPGSDSEKLVRPSPDLVDQLVQMGFLESEARSALVATRNNLKDALDRLLL